MAPHELIVEDDRAELRRVEKIPPSRSKAVGLADIVTHSPSMERVRRLAERAARSPIPVLIEGARGVGKELLARSIHGASARRSRPFVTVRCEDADEASIEATLFGGEAGAEAGGKIGETGGGTLFLDEVGALPVGVQARLERVLAESGGRTGDLRLIAATSRRLIDLVSHSGFHEPLFNRLNVLPIWLPPLRERRADIPDLAASLFARLAGEAGRSRATGISSAAMALLVAHDWPGNIRELERAMLRAVMLSGGGELVPQDFPQLLAGAGVAEAQDGSRGGTAAAAPHAGVAYQEQPKDEGVSAADARADTQKPARYGVAWLLDERGEMRAIGALEEEVIRFAIGHYRGRMSEVARRLGIGRSTLYRKIKDYGIAPDGAVAS